MDQSPIATCLLSELQVLETCNLLLKSNLTA